MRAALLFLAACGGSSAQPIDAALDATRDAFVPDAPPDAFVQPAYGVQTAVPKDTTRFDVPPPMGYYEYLPSLYDALPDHAWDTILFFPGIGETGNGTTDLVHILRTGLPQIIADGHFPANDRFVVLSVQNGNFAAAADIDAFVVWAKAHYRLDPHHLYLTGLSYGGMASWSYGRADGDAGAFAALVPISGNGDVGDGCAFKHTPLWAFHGSDDANGPTMPIYSVNGVATINACAPDVAAKVTLFPGRGHDPSTWNAVYDLSGMTATTDAAHAPYDQSIYAWMLQYAR